MRFAVTITALGLVSVALAEAADNGRVPAESSFIIKLADSAIEADGAEAVQNREVSRAIFANSFLQGFSVPDSTLPVNPNLYSSRLNGKGWQAGQEHRRRHPNSVAQVMHEYGYVESEAVGLWTYGFEAGNFQADNVNEQPSAWGQTCWHLSAIFDSEHASDIARLVPSERLIQGGTIRLRIRGYLSPPGSFGHFGACPRQFYATSVSSAQ